jgi:opacity protein-like surface antigen
MPVGNTEFTMQQTRIFHTLSTLIVAAVAATLLAACASAPKVFVNQDPNADFTQYKTYNYEPVLGTDERKGYRSILSNFMVAAMDREMQSRGYVLSDNPDLLLNFYIHTEEKIRTTSSPSMGGYYGYRGGYYGSYGGYDTTVTQYTEGTLNIDLVDSASATLVWEGVTVGRITDKVRENLEEAVDAAIPEIMSNYTQVAYGFVPPPPVEPAK